MASSLALSLQCHMVLFSLEASISRITSAAGPVATAWASMTAAGPWLDWVRCAARSAPIDGAEPAVVKTGLSPSPLGDCGWDEPLVPSVSKSCTWGCIGLQAGHLGLQAGAAFGWLVRTPKEMTLPLFCDRRFWFACVHARGWG